MTPNMLLAPSIKEHVRRLASFPHREGALRPLNVLLIGVDEGIEGWSEDYPTDILFTVSDKDVEGASCVKAQDSELPFVDNSFDAVVVQGAWIAQYEEGFRVLKPSGCMVVYENVNHAVKGRALLSDGDSGALNSAFFHMSAMPEAMVLKQLIVMPTPEATQVGCAPFILVGTKEA